MTNKSKKRKAGDANLASEFYVASQLYRLGYTVTITLGHTKEIDLVVVHPNGKTITVDVKGLKNTTNWPLTPKLKSKDHFYILINYKNKFGDLFFLPEVFVIPSLEIDNLLSSWAGKPNVKCVGYRDIKNSKYKDAWELLFKQE